MPIRIGIVDFDSSHCVEFTRRINHVGISADQWVDGAEVVVGCPGTSLLAPERIAGFTHGHRSFGFVAFCQRHVCHVTIDMQFVYRELLNAHHGFHRGRTGERAGLSREAAVVGI